MTQRGSTSLTYDNNGNLTGDGTNSFVWNARNQLVSMTGPGLAASFQHDAFGRRTRKTLNGVTTDFLYDGDNAVQELSGGAPLANLLAAGTDQTIKRSEGGVSRTFLSDALGSTLGLLDDNGALLTEYSYEPFGRRTTTGAASNNAAQFTGRENDGTGIYYYRARYYSPTLQRFISEDPIGFSGGDTNLYAYVFNSPTNYTDSSGRIIDTIWDVGALIYDLYKLGTGGRKDFADNLTDVGLNLGGLVLPGVPAMGPIRKAARYADDAVDLSRGGRKIPNGELLGPPNKRGNAPIGSDGHPVELHHRGQQPDSPLDAMTRTDHRGGDNYKKNHDNTGQDPSEIDRKKWKREQKKYWKNEWDCGRFDQ